MNNKYSVACITLVRDKYKINTDGIRVVYTADSIRDSIRTQKNDSQVPTLYGRLPKVGVAHRVWHVVFVVHISLLP